MESKDGSNEEVFEGFSWGEIVGVRRAFVCALGGAVRWLVLGVSARWFAPSGVIAALRPWAPAIASPSQWAAARRSVASSRCSSLLV